LTAPDTGFIPRRMNPDWIRKRLRSQAPHVLRTSDGLEFHIPHPEFVLVGRRNVVIEDEEGQLEVIDPLHVVSIRSAATPKDRNESRTR
jgi:hypothetical protein